MIKTILYISNQSVTVFQSLDQNRSVEFICIRSWEKVSDIENILVMLPQKSPVSIILDLLEEDITIESFPRLSIWDRNAVKSQHIQQKQAEDVSFVHATWTEQYRKSDGSVEMSLLATSITSPPTLTTFMRGLEGAKTVLTGIYSAPFLIESYFKLVLSHALSLSKEQINGPLFLISRQSRGVYRQTFFNHSTLQISRLIEINDNLDENLELSEEFLTRAVKSVLIEEIKLAQNYLYNQRALEVEASISYVFMDSDQSRLEGLEELSKTLGLIEESKVSSKYPIKVVNLSSNLTEKERLTNESNGVQVSQILASYVLKRAPKTHFNTSYLKSIKRQVLGVRSLVGVNSLIVFGLLLYMTLSFVDVYIGQERLQVLELSLVNHQAEELRLQKIVQRQVDAKKLKVMVELSEAILIAKSDRILGFDVKPIAKIVAQQSEHIQLTKVDWKRQGEFDSTRYQIELEGLVYPFTDYYQEPVKWVDDFREALQKLKAVTQTEIIKEPLNRDLKQTLTVVANESRNRVDGLPFQIRLEVDYEPEK